MSYFLDASSNKIKASTPCSCNANMNGFFCGSRNDIFPLPIATLHAPFTLALKGDCDPEQLYECKAGALEASISKKLKCPFGCESGKAEICCHQRRICKQFIYSS